jgi:hypothetical protein
MGSRSKMVVRAPSTRSTAGRPSRAPSLIDERRKRWTDFQGPSCGFPDAHHRFVLRWIPQWLTVGCRDGDVPPAAEAAQEELIGTGPMTDIRHGGAVPVDVLQHVGARGEGHQPGPTPLRAGIVVAGGPMGQAVLGLIVGFNRVGDHRL